MVDTVMQQSPLIELGLDQPIVDLNAVTITEQPFQTQFILRGRLTDAAFCKAVKSILSIELPAQPNTMLEANGWTVFWMSPDQWLLLTDDAAQASKAVMLAGALEDVSGLISEVSSGQTLIRIQGEKAMAVVKKGTTLDVHPAVFKVGQCAQTVFSKINVLICPRHEGDKLAFDIIVRRSFADFLGRWLINACYEYEEHK